MFEKPARNGREPAVADAGGMAASCGRPEGTSLRSFARWKLCSNNFDR